MAPESLQLPMSVTTPGDLNRLVREVVTIDEQLVQLKVRATGTTVKLPRTSRLMGQTIELNKLNLLQAADRERLRQALQTVQQKAPVVHFSFSADPSPEFMLKLMTWLRREIHPFVLVTTGLQPNIGVGCKVRSVNHTFDFSLSQSLQRNRQILVDRFAPPQAPPPQSPVPPPAPAAAVVEAP